MLQWIQKHGASFASSLGLRDVFLGMNKLLANFTRDVLAFLAAGQKVGFDPSTELSFPH